MALVTLKEILADADKNNYGVAAFNLLNMEAVKAGVKAAEELRSPIIFQIAEIQLDNSPLEYMIPMMLELAKRATVPVAVHFDHGLTKDAIYKALELGCTSIMFDGASLSFEENVKLTKEFADYAHSKGASCEAELGVVGGGEAGGYEHLDEVLTKPDEAVEFVERTGCDALAVAIGNAHGPYLKEPQLSLDRLSEIDKCVTQPLVLHGGSGISSDDFRRCIDLGIRKINVATSLQQNVMKKIREHDINKIDYFKLSELQVEGVYEDAKHHIEIFGSMGKAW